MKLKIKHKRLDPNKHLELKALSKLVGEFIEYWGFKSVYGRMWCYLYMLKEPLDSRQLAQLLKISPALVTQSVQVLLKYKVIFETDKGKNGMLRFAANPQLSTVIASVLSHRELNLLRTIHTAQEKLMKSETKIESDLALNKERVEQVGAWIHLASMVLSTGINLLNQEQGPLENPKHFQTKGFF